MDPTHILFVDAAADAYALALTRDMLAIDPLLNFQAVYNDVREEVGMAGEDCRSMILGIPDVAEWGEGVQR